MPNVRLQEYAGSVTDFRERIPVYSYVADRLAMTVNCLMRIQVKLWVCEQVCWVITTSKQSNNPYRKQEHMMTSLFFHNDVILRSWES